MKKIIALINLMLLSYCCLSQNEKNNLIKLTAGRIIFGTGDFFGYSANIEYSKYLGRKKNAKKHIALGAEFSFDNGARLPKVINPTIQEFLDTYYSTTNIVFTPKLTYYPFNNTLVKGINFTGGLSIGYTSQQKEFRASRITDPNSSSSIRASYLKYLNEAILGYRITAGYEYWLKKILLGARLDFHSYTNGDINTFYGLKTGIRF